MGSFYEVWDDSLGNRLGEFETLAEARALLGAVLDTGGSTAVRTLTVLGFTPTDKGEYAVATVLEGDEFLADRNLCSSDGIPSAGRGEA